MECFICNGGNHFVALEDLHVCDKCKKDEIIVKAKIIETTYLEVPNEKT